MKKVLFEISFEVCNLVGGIHTVLSTKAHCAKQFSDEYVLLGPYRHESQNEFIRKELPAHLEPLSQILSSQGITLHYGLWDIKSKPIVWLLDFHSEFQNVDSFKGKLYTHFGVDSLTAGYDVNEPMAFSLACAKAIVAYEALQTESHNTLVHSHEWMCGYTNLALKLLLNEDQGERKDIVNRVKQISTIFTTHATMLGRTLTSNGVDVNSLAQKSADDILNIAKSYNVAEKHTAECACAQFSDAFTTVSDFTKTEVAILLKQNAYVTANGINLLDMTYADYLQKRSQSRFTLTNIAIALFAHSQQKDLSKAQFWITSGRHEVGNKGYDLVIDSFSELPESKAPVVLFILVPYEHYDLEHELNDRLNHGTKGDNPLVYTHYVKENPITDHINENKLWNKEHQNHNVIYAPIYISKSDDLTQTDYAELLFGFDLGIFPSRYEPWGYTPAECIARFVPVVTTTKAGFGLYYQNNTIGDEITILDGSTSQELQSQLSATLTKMQQSSQKESRLRSLKSRASSLRNIWILFYTQYEDVYTKLIEG